MFDLFWSLLNSAAVVYFLFLSIGLAIRGRKILQNHPKVLTYPILAGGILAILSSNQSEEMEHSVIPSDYNMEVIQLDFSLVNKLEVVLITDRATGELDPLLSSSSLSGFVAGRSWKQKSVKLTTDGLEVSGSVYYSLMGIPVFSIDKSIKDLVKKPPQR